MAYTLKIARERAETPDTELETVLEMKGISKNFGGVKALIDADFSCAKGEVHALIGENGAGKSTLVKILCGVVKNDTGTIKINGKEVHIHHPQDAGKNGIAAVFQELSLVPELSVSENIYLGHEPKNKLRLIDFVKMNTMAAVLLKELGINVDVRSVVEDLSLADKQLVEIAKALSTEGVEIIVFDEPTSALGQAEVELLFKLIRKLKNEGKTAIFISHKMNELEQIADRVTVFRDARFVQTFKMGTVSNAQITNWVAGRSLDETYPKRRTPISDEVVLKLENVRSGNKLKNINVEIHRGEILGIAGLQGHGQTEFLRSIFGVAHVDDGAIYLKGERIKLRHPKEAIRKGIALIPEDRKTEGLHITMTVGENLSMMSLEKISTAGWLSRKKEHEVCSRAIQQMSIKTPNIDQLAQNLSGGNQQKIVIAKAIATEADILLLGDPTRGIDIGTKAELYQLFRNESEKGRTILLYSTEMNELIGLCDRVLVFEGGAVVSELKGTDITETAILNASMGIKDGGKAE